MLIDLFVYMLLLTKRSSANKRQITIDNKEWDLLPLPVCLTSHYCWVVMVGKGYQEMFCWLLRYMRFDGHHRCLWKKAIRSSIQVVITLNHTSKGSIGRSSKSESKEHSNKLLRSLTFQLNFFNCMKETKTNKQLTREMLIRGSEILFFWKILRMYLMNGPLIKITL